MQENGKKMMEKEGKNEEFEQENGEFEGLITDEIFGIRWKNGAFDRRVRGEKRMKDAIDDYNNRAIFSMNSDSVYRFLVNFFAGYESVADLQIANSLLFEGVDDGEEILMTKEKVFESVFDFPVTPDVFTEAEFNYFTYGMRIAFLKYNTMFLCSMATPAVYAEFTGEKENTIRSRMKRCRYDTVDVCGVRFILVQEDEMFAYNEFLMRRKLSVITDDKQNEPLMAIYERMYPDKKIDQIDTVRAWLEYESMTPTPEHFTPIQREYVQSAYGNYCKWCKQFKFTVVSMKTFSMKITEFGFKRFNTKKRGFYYYSKNVLT